MQQGDVRGVNASPALDLTAFLVVESLNALSQTALLFFIGVGLTLIFSIMRIVNFAHSTFYILGALIGYSVVRFSGSFWLALVMAPLAVGIVGALFELGILRRLYRRDESAFLMVTFGLAVVLTEMIRLGWGTEALQMGPYLRGQHRCRLHVEPSRGGRHEASRWRSYNQHQLGCWPRSFADRHPGIFLGKTRRGRLDPATGARAWTIRDHR